MFMTIDTARPTVIFENKMFFNIRHHNSQLPLEILINIIWKKNPVRRYRMGPAKHSATPLVAVLYGFVYLIFCPE